ncbi:MAG: ribonuclease HI [Candidatus Taylorbacteria bacterium]
MSINIFTDGSSRGNPGPGGWGAVIVASEVIELGGGEKQTTNNRMELTAAAKALASIKHESVNIYTDSAYLINGITKWIHGWKKNGWKTKTKDDVLNKDLWQDIDHSIVTGSLKIKWHHIGGHVGIVGNERCDEIATAFADGDDIKLYNGSLADYKKAINGRDISDITHDTALAATKKDSRSRSDAKAYSYVSKVDGTIEIHKTWKECEDRVRGARGARFKKALSRGEEQEIIDNLQIS